MVALAYPPGIGAEAMRKLERVAARYGVELVALHRLEEAASRHGSPLPDSLGPVPDPGFTEAHAIQAPPPPPELDRDPATPANRSRDPLPETEPTSVREWVGGALLVLSFGVASAGSWMWLGRGTVAAVGAALVLGAVVTIPLTVWWLKPHKAATRARDRAKTRRERRGAFHHTPPAMTEAEFDAIEEALEPLYRHGNDLDNNFSIPTDADDVAEREKPRLRRASTVRTERFEPPKSRSWGRLIPVSAGQNC